MRQPLDPPRHRASTSGAHRASGKAISGVSIQKLDSTGKVIGAASVRVWKWRVTLGKKITGTAKQRKLFETFSQAKAFVDAAVTARATKGKQALLMPAHEMHEAATCRDRLKTVGASLTEATAFYLKHHRPSTLTRTFVQVAAELIRMKRRNQRRKRTVRAYVGVFRRFGENYRKTPINRITGRQIEAWLDEQEYGAVTRRNYMRDLGVLWNFAVKRNYCAENPCEKIERPIIEDVVPEILAPDLAAKLLEAAWAAPEKEEEDFRGMVAYIAIGMFAGPRTSELCSLDWSEIDLEAGTIEIRGSKSKTRQRRIISVSENLRSWLLPVHRPAGPVVPVQGSDFWDTRERLRLRAGMSAWPNNVLRHSFGSYFYGKTANENLTAAQMGNSPHVVFKHYRELVKPKAVERFWNLVPPSEGKIAPFHKGSDSLNRVAKNPQIEEAV